MRHNNIIAIYSSNFRRRTLVSRAPGSARAPGALPQRRQPGQLSSRTAGRGRCPAPARNPAIALAGRPAPGSGPPARPGSAARRPAPCATTSDRPPEEPPATTATARRSRIHSSPESPPPGNMARTRPALQTTSTPGAGSPRPGAAAAIKRAHAQLPQVAESRRGRQPPAGQPRSVPSECRQHSDYAVDLPRAKHPHNSVVHPSRRNSRSRVSRMTLGSRLKCSASYSARPRPDHCATVAVAQKMLAAMTT
jgi:hypothetical protein